MEHEGRLTVSSDFGNLLRRHRLAAGLSQEALAERARLSANGIGALERGYRRSPQRETLALLIGALGLDDEQRRELEAAATRTFAPHRTARVTVGPQPDVTMTNLPLSVTSFVGRDREMAEVEERLTRYRLLSLVGSGGVGKTRLAIQVGAQVLPHYRDGVWFVDLAPIGDPTLVGSVITHALGMTQRQSVPVDESIILWLKRKQLLLILDNCEHVVETTAALVAGILATAPDVRILATSRQSLNISGEAIHRVPSLTLPEESTGLKTDAALQYDAIALFVDRAKAADSGFVLTSENAPIIAEICRRLDGIALAIELAAARVKVISIPHLAARLNERFEILTGGSRSSLPRQRTLTALIDWSYKLLLPEEQLLCARLGTFVGGFELEAAIAVCSGDGLYESAVFDLLVSLVDKSLVIADTSRRRERYRMLESTAAYARERLSASGEVEALARRHAEYFGRLAEATGQSRPSSGSDAAWRAEIELELGNYRAALDWTLTRSRDAVLGGAIASALGFFWWAAGLGGEGYRWIDLALPRIDESAHPALAARLQWVLSSFYAGKPAYEAAEKALQLYEAAGDALGTARARRSLGWALFQLGQLDDARATLMQALGELRKCGDSFNAANALRPLALIEMTRGNIEQARDLLAQALEIWRARGDEVGISFVLGNLAEVEFAAGDYSKALHAAQEALEFAARGKNLQTAAMWHANSAVYRIALGDLTGALDSAREALRISQQVQYGFTIGPIAQHFALLASLFGDTRSGAQLLGFVDGRYTELGMQRELTEKWGYDKLMAALRDALSEEEIKALTAEGATWSDDMAIEAASAV